MTNGRLLVSGIFVCVLLLVGLSGVAPLPSSSRSSAQKIKAEEVVAKHLESIGAADLRAPARSRAVGGTVAFIRQTAGGRAEGKALILSEGNKVLLAAVFEAGDYPFEKMGFDGKKVTVKQYIPGRLTPLGDFIKSHEVIFKEGLIGGTLSSAWPLLDLVERKSKLEYNGTDKIDGRPVHKLRYSPRKGSDLKIKLFFDAETFRHVRTEYEREVAATMGDRPGASAGRVDTRYQLVENFSDFKTENGLTLPRSYNLQYRFNSQNTSPLLMNWRFALTDFVFGETIDPTDFNAEK